MNRPATPSSNETARISRRTFGLSMLAGAAAGLVACTSGESTASPTSSVASTNTAGPTTSVAGTTSETDGASPTSAAPTTVDTDFFDMSQVHVITLTFDTGEYDAMIDTYVESGDKSWIQADVTIDGVEYRQAGMRLKGNSSLAGLGGAAGIFPGGGPAGQPVTTDQTGETSPTGSTVSTGTEVTSAGGGGFGGMASVSAEEPEGLPWLIRLDKNIEDQNHQGHTEFVVRSNGTETAMNEAVSVGLLHEAGLATQQATAVRFTVNDLPSRLRLVLENPNEKWTSDNLGSGKLYKADASGDYSYRGEDAESYIEAWEQEAGEEDLYPLIEFLDFVNNSDDATFVAQLDDHLDIDEFATYMAIEDLLQNFDDISGPGNNSYLYLDEATDKFTVVAWDHNLALSSGGLNAAGGFDPSQIPGGSLPEGFDPSQIPGGSLPEGFDPSQIPGGGGVGAFGKSNALADRFMATPKFTALYDAELARLRTELFESGTAQQILDRWSTTLLASATDLVDAETITSEAEAIAGFFVAE